MLLFKELYIMFKIKSYFIIYTKQVHKTIFERLRSKLTGLLLKNAITHVPVVALLINPNMYVYLYIHR